MLFNRYRKLFFLLYSAFNINHENMENKLKKFNAYMIDYIKKLDVGDKDEIIIV